MYRGCLLPVGLKGWLRLPLAKSWVAYGRVNGSQFWRSFKTRDEAELYLARQLQRRANHQPAEPFVRVRFELAAEAWYTRGATERGWKASTRRDYRSVLSRYE